MGLFKNRPKRHGLGFGNGALLEFADGTVAYMDGASERFRVRPEDVVSTSSEKASLTKARLRVLGHGTTLAEAEVPVGAVSKIDAWFRERKSS